MISRDEAGYVEEIQIGGQMYTGDEAMELLQLPSPHLPFPTWKAGGWKQSVMGWDMGLGSASMGQKNWRRKVTGWRRFLVIILKM